MLELDGNRSSPSYSIYITPREEALGTHNRGWVDPKPFWKLQKIQKTYSFQESNPAVQPVARRCTD
jgi:hypothetical protein